MADEGRALVAEEEIDPTRDWLVGLAGQFNFTADESAKSVLLHGLYVARRWAGWFDVGIKGMVSTNYADGLRTMRSALALTTRAGFDLFGLRWTYGVGVEADVRINDHFWIVHVLPAEVGLVFWDRSNWHMQVLFAPRLPIAGELIDNFIIDPTGINNSTADRELRVARSAPDYVIGLAFTRVID